jgi:hypothetical protein
MNFFFFLHFFFFFKKNRGSEFFQKYTCGAVWAAAGTCHVPHGGRGARGTVEPPTAVGHDGRGLVCFQIFVIFLFELEWR